MSRWIHYIADEADLWKVDVKGQRIKWMGRLDPIMAARVADALNDGLIAEI